MTLRTGLKLIVNLAVALTALSRPACAAETDQPQFFELRIYHTQSAAQQQRLNDYWQHAAVPAYNRLGIRPVGVFTELKDSATNQIYVLIPCDSLAAFGAIPERLAADPVYQRAAADFLAASKTNSAYERFESSLLVAFDGMKHVAEPPAEHRPNIFELRTYLSPSEGKGLNKVQMFNRGEITLMKEVGLAPVFYGRTLVGAKMPCLTYMLSADNLAAHKKHWQEFSAAPVWKKLSGDPQYQDNVSGIISVMLQRTAASQL